VFGEGPSRASSANHFGWSASLQPLVDAVETSTMIFLGTSSLCRIPGCPFKPTVWFAPSTGEFGITRLRTDFPPTSGYGVPVRSIQRIRTASLQAAANLCA
jgi:hypothetical protein